MTSLTEGGSPKIIQSFQSDRFMKRNNCLNIPDTIPEQYSGELSANSLKIEVSEIKNLKDEISKLSSNHSFSSDDSSNASTVTPTSNSFLKNCEKRLCELSSIDENSFLSANSNIEVMDFNKLSEELGLNCTLSTPPNELRQQIKILRDDVAKTHEFHDLEIQCMKDMKIIDDESDSYLQLYTKHIELLELYTSLKKEYEYFKNKHEKVADELHFTTTNCFEKLCSQIEASDNSLNLSNASFASFNTEIKSSTMLGFKSEVETSIVNDRTILAQDPLALSIDTPVRSSKNLFKFPLNCSNQKEKESVKELINSDETIEKKDNMLNFSSDYTNKVLNVETLLFDKIKEMDDLESRLLKVEDVSKILQDECDRITAVSQNENVVLKKKLSEKSEELEKLTEKLLTEILALNPSLSNSLTEMSTFKLLTVFIETIMEICNNVQNQLIKKFDTEKLDWEKHKKSDSTLIENLQNQIETLTNEIKSFEFKIKNFEDVSKQKEEIHEQLIEANKIISIRNDEINFLQAHYSNNKKDRKDLDSADEAISKLQSQLMEMEVNKTNLENQCKHLEETIKNLKQEIDLKETMLKESTKSTVSTEDSVRENEVLKEILRHLNETTNNLRNELSSVKKERCDSEENPETNFELLREGVMSLISQNTKLESLFDSLLENKKIFTDAFASIYSNFSINHETAAQLLNEKFHSLLGSFLDGLNDEKWLNVLSEGIIACCSYVKRELNEELSIKADEWKIKIDDQIKVIEDLNNHLQVLHQNTKENLSTISELKFEKETAEKLCESLKEQLSQAEENILARENENIILKSFEEDLKKATEDNSTYLESLAKLKTELLSLENEKLEIESKYEELKEANENLQILITTKDMILQDLDNFKTNYEKSSGEYEAKIEELNLLISSLKDQLLIAKSECNRKDDELQKLLSDTENKENDVLLIDSLKIQIGDLNNKIKDYDEKTEELNKIINLKNLAEAELEENKNLISKLIEESNLLKSQSCDFKKFNEDLSLAQETIEKLKSDLLEAKTEKNNFEVISKKQDTVVSNLQSELETKTTLIEKLQKQVQFFRLDFKENTAKMNEMSNENQSIKDLCDILKELLFEYEKIICSLKEENVTKLNEKENLERLCGNLKIQLFEAEKHISLLKGENEAKLLEKENLEKLCESLKEQLSEAEKNVTIKQEENEAKLLEKENIQQLYENLKEQLSEAEKHISLLQEENESKVHEKKNLEKLCESLKEQLFLAEKSVSVKEEENEAKLLEKENLEKLCEKLKQQLAEAEKNVTIKQEENEANLLEKENIQQLCENLKEQLSEAEKHISLLQEENESKVHEKETLEKLCESLKEQLFLAEKNVSVKEEENEAKLLEKEILEKLCEKLKQQLAEAEKHGTLLKEESTTKLQEKENLEQLCENLKEQLSEAEKRIILLEEENESKIQEKENVEKLCESLKEQQAEAQKNILKTNEIYENNIRELICEKEKLEKMAENYKEQLSEALKNICIRDEEITILKTCETDLKNAKRDLSTADEAIQHLRIEISELECKKLNVENKCLELERANASLENSSAAKDKILKDLENYKANSEKVQNDYKTKVEKLEHLSEQYDELKKELERAENSISLHKKEIDLLLSNNKKAEENLATAVETIEKLHAQIVDVENEKSNLKSEINSKDTRLKEVEEEATSYQQSKTENKGLKEKILEMEKITQILKEELDIAKEEANNIEKLKDKKLEELKAEILSLGNKNNRFRELFDSLVENKSLFPNAICGIYSTSNSMDDTSVKLLEDKLKSALPNYSFNSTDDEKWLSAISEAIVACCNFVGQELNKESASKENEWKVEIDSKASVIENLEIQIDRLRKTTEKNDLQILEMKLEKDKFEKLCENMKVQLNEEEKIIGTLENEMVSFKSCKEDLKKTKLDLVAADEKILNLKSKLLSVENEKWEIENRCIQLEQEANTKGNTKDMTLRSGRTVDLRSRRLDKLEEINNNLMELINSILMTLNFPNIDKLKLMSVRDYPSILKKINVHLQETESKTKNLEAANAELDEECDSYAKTIKDLKKEAAAVWKANKEKTEALECEIKKLKEQQIASEKEKENLLAKVSKLDSEYQKLKEASLSKGTTSNCNCGGELKKIHELKRTILMKEQKILELEDLENQNSLYKSQIKYLENALEQEKKKMREETKKNKKLQNEISELTKTQKSQKENTNDNEMLEELKLRGSITGGVVKDFMDKEKMRKLSKDIEILKEVCRARYMEIKRLEAENASLKSTIPKNSNQMDSPIRTRSQRKSKTLIKEMWKPEVDGKENFILKQ